MYERIKKLCDSHGINIKKLERELGFARSSLCKMQASSPSIDKVSAIAEYFGVSIDYLVYGHDHGSLSEEYLSQLIDERIALRLAGMRIEVKLK